MPLFGPSSCGTILDGNLVIGFESSDQFRTSGGSEELLCQHSLNFDKLDSAITLVTVSLTALTKQSAGSGTYFVRVGGTVNVADGTIYATLVTTHNAGFVSIPDNVIGPPLARPTGQQIVKITGASAGALDIAFIRAFEALFS